MKTISDGTSEKAALFAHIAARLNGIPTRRHAEWFAEEGGPTLSQQQVERVVSLVRWDSPEKKPRGRPGKKREKLPWIIREWLEVREERLGLLQVLIIVRGGGAPSGPLRDQLSNLPGVTRVTETATNRDLVLDALFRDTLEESRLRAQIEELTDRPVHWEHVRSTTRQPSLATWIHLANAQGVAEGLSPP